MCWFLHASLTDCLTEWVAVWRQALRHSVILFEYFIRGCKNATFTEWRWLRSILVVQVSRRTNIISMFHIYLNNLIWSVSVAYKSTPFYYLLLSLHWNTSWKRKGKNASKKKNCYLKKLIERMQVNTLWIWFSKLNLYCYNFYLQGCLANKLKCHSAVDRNGQNMKANPYLYQRFSI